MGVSTRTYKKADGTTGTRLVGENGSSQDVGGVLLFDSSGNVLVGQATMAASLPVAIASNQSAVPTSPSLPTAALSTRVAINAASSGDNTLVALTFGFATSVKRKQGLAVSKFDAHRNGVFRQGNECNHGYSFLLQEV